MILIVGSLLSVLWLCASGSVNVARGQIIDTMRVLQVGGSGQCLSVEERERVRNDIHQVAIQSTENWYTCNGTPGWRRVAFINMTDTSYNCPTGLNLTSYSKRTCGWSHTTWGGCSSTTFSVGDLPYSGRIRGYQVGLTSAFFWHNYNQGINSYYVDSVGLTHGVVGKQQHIWIFVAGISEVSRYGIEGCPCDTAAQVVVHAFVGNDYFCESSLHSQWDTSYSGVLFPNDVLWNGQNCTSTSTCCLFNNPPWFTKNLPTVTTDDTELRLCIDSPPMYDDVPIELIELYVQWFVQQ